MASIDLFDQWWEAPAVFAYLAAGAASARYSYRDRYQGWMDREIRAALRWASDNPALKQAQETPDETRERLRQAWMQKAHDDAIFDSLCFGAVWVVSWPMRWIWAKPAPSQQELMLMDRAARERLRQLEREAGLTPLDGD